jgi:hypothetical protein
VPVRAKEKPKAEGYQANQKRSITMSEKEDKLQETKEYWKDFPEAPVSDSFKWVDPQGFEHLSTLRAWSPSNLISQYSKFQAAILALDGKPINSRPQPMPKQEMVQEKDEQGLPVVDPDGNPILQPAPAGERNYNVAAFFHDKTKNGKDVLKVVTVEQPYNTKYGVSAFHGGPEGWKNWALGVENKYAPTKGFLKVAIKDPDDFNKYPEILSFG